MSASDADQDGAVTATTEDGFLGGRLVVRQPKVGPRAGLDAIMLAAAVPASAGQRALEAGMGVGVVALALAHRVPGVEVTGIEIQSGLAGLAVDNARANGLAGRVRVVQGDVTAPAAVLERSGLGREQFAQVFANPPFYAEGEARAAAGPVKRRAHMADKDALDGWIGAMTALAAPHAVLTLIHRPAALPVILTGLAGRFGAVVVMPLYPRVGEAASRVLVQAVKGSRGALRIAPGLVLHEAAGGFTAEADDVLRHGKALRVLA